MCSAFATDCGYNNSTIILIRDVFCPNTKCSGRLRLHKKTFQSLGRSDYQCPKCASVCPMRNIPFENQKNSFLLSLGQGVYIFEENLKSVQDGIGDVYCPGKSCLNREKCESIGGYVTTPRSIYGCGKCGAQLFVHKAPFTLQEHVKTTKTDKTRFFAKKDELVTGKNICYLMSHFNQPNIERKNCVCRTTKFRRLLEICTVQPVETKSVFAFQPIKRLVSTTVKKGRAGCHVSNIPFKDQKPLIMLFGGDGTHCFARKTSREYEKEQPSPFLKKFLRQSQPSTSELEPKKDKSSPNME